MPSPLLLLQIDDKWLPTAIITLPGRVLHDAVYTEPKLQLPATLELLRLKAEGVKHARWLRPGRGAELRMLASPDRPGREAPGPDADL